MNINYLRLVVTLSLFIALTPSAYSANKDRRSFLRLFGASTLVPKAALESVKPAPVVPVPPAAVETVTLPAKVLITYRSEFFEKEIKRWHQHIVPGKVLNAEQFDILADWLKQKHPAAKQVETYYQELLQAVQQHDEFERKILQHQNVLFHQGPGELIFAEGEDYHKQSQVLSRNISVASKKLLDTVTEEPWASWKWEKVFSARLAEAEIQLARELNVPVTEIYQAFEQMLAFAQAYPDVDKTHPLIVSLTSADFLEQAPPLYSEKLIEAIHQKISSFAPHFADFVKQKNTAAEINSNLYSGRHNKNPIKEALLGTTHFISLISSSPKLRFLLHDDSLRHTPEGPEPEQLAPFYIKALDYFSMLKLHIEKLQPSDFKTLAEKYVNELVHELTLELETLPQRVAAQRSHQPIDKKWDDPTWATYGVSTPQQMAEASQKWLNVLRGLNVAAGTTQIFANVVEKVAANAANPIVPETTVSCAPLLIEHAPETPLNVDATVTVEEAEPVLVNRGDQ